MADSPLPGLEATPRTSGKPRALINGKTELFGTDADKFSALADEWQEHLIGAARIDFNHSAYHQIIGMGWEAVSMILERVQRGEAGWIYALTCITGEQAEAPEMRGAQVVEAWLQWGRSRGELKNGRI